MLTPIAYIGQPEILIIAGVVIVLFGGAKMAQWGKGLGQGIREFKTAMNGDEDKTKTTEETEGKTVSTSTAEAK